MPLCRSPSQGFVRVAQQLKVAVAVAAALIARRGPRSFGPPSSLAPANIALKAERLRERAAVREARERARFERETRRWGYAPAA